MIAGHNDKAAFGQQPTRTSDGNGAATRRPLRLTHAPQGCSAESLQQQPTIDRFRHRYYRHRWPPPPLAAAADAAAAAAVAHASVHRAAVVTAAAVARADAGR
eukprot:6192007-Pleurochrysis_carterae.AAC.4